MKNLLRRLWKEEEGQDLVEYALLVVLIALGAIAAMQGLGNQLKTTFGNVSSNMKAS